LNAVDYQKSLLEEPYLKLQFLYLWKTEPTMQNPDQLGYSPAIPKTAHTNDALRIFDLYGKVAIVTGATGVLGRALAIGLARAGAKVGIRGRRGEAAEATSAAIREFQGQSICLTADVLDVS